MIRGELPESRVNEQRAGGTQAAWIERWKDGGKRREGSVVEAWLKGVSMVGLPRNLMLVPDAGKPSSKTREHTNQHQSRGCTWP